MARYISALMVGLLAFSTAAAAESPKVVIRWHGQSFFEVISSQGTRIVFDPQNLEEFGQITVPADLVLISHLHSDHNAVGVIANRDQARIISGLKMAGKKVEWNPVDEKFRDVHVRSVGVYHDDVQGAERGKNTIFIVDVDGLHIVHLGDLGHLLSEEQVKEIGPVDVLMIPVGGVYTINGSEAKQVVEQLKPRLDILPMHYGTRNFDALLPVDEFLEDQKNVQRLPNTNELVIDSGAKPAQPAIVVLNWRKGAAGGAGEGK
ncbi:MAG: MBL fold metallo-hydrolase [Planctomycetes bacterium]|nr:MBL fold metallo-hydrolase [Planctomycetota bacterium]